MSLDPALFPGNITKYYQYCNIPNIAKNGGIFPGKEK